MEERAKKQKIREINEQEKEIIRIEGKKGMEENMKME